MNEWASAGLPFVSVLLGAGITYWTNVKQRRRTKVEDIFHEAIAAVAVASASREYWSDVLLPGASGQEQEDFNKEVRRVALWDAIKANAQARAAVARASAYDPSLQAFLSGPIAESMTDAHAEEVMRHLRQGVARVRGAGSEPPTRC